MEEVLNNSVLLKRFQALEKFSDDDQQTVIKIIDAMIAKQQVEKALKPL